MDEHYEREGTTPEDPTPEDRGSGMFWLAGILFVVVVGVAAAAMYNSYQQKNTISQLTAQTSSMNATVSQLQNQLNDTTAKLNDVSSNQALAAQTAAQAAADAVKTSNAHAVPGASRADMNKLKEQFQSSLDDQQKQLQSTQGDIAQARTDLQGNIDTARDQLNGSIAKTHDELVTLEKRGEHRYFEFDLTRSKQFMREGPISLMVRRSDPKHSNIDMTVLVNDKQISKKHVNLYEPVSIYETDGGEPFQIVVNRIDAKGIHGYVSTPRYSAADLSASASTPQPTEPRVTSPSPAPSSNSTPNTNNNSTNSTAADPGNER
jgi:hypothetical protein